MPPRFPEGQGFSNPAPSFQLRGSTSPLTRISSNRGVWSNGRPHARIKRPASARMSASQVSTEGAKKSELAGCLKSASRNSRLSPLLNRCHNLAPPRHQADGSRSKSPGARSGPRRRCRSLPAVVAGAGRPDGPTRPRARRPTPARTSRRSRSAARLSEPLLLGHQQDVAVLQVGMGDASIRGAVPPASARGPGAS